MEEAPIQSPESKPETDLTPDPEKIGDLLLKHELPGSKLSRTVPLAAEQSPKLPVSHEKLRDKVSRYRAQKAARPEVAVAKTEPEVKSGSETNKIEDLPEAHFERRHEVIDQNPPEDAVLPQQLPAIDRTDAPQTPPAAPPPVAPPIWPSFNQETPATKPASITTQLLSYRKPLLYGLAAGAVTGLALVFVYFT